MAVMIFTAHCQKETSQMTLCEALMVSSRPGTAVPGWPPPRSRKPWEPGKEQAVHSGPLTLFTGCGSGRPEHPEGRPHTLSWLPFPTRVGVLTSFYVEGVFSGFVILSLLWLQNSQKTCPMPLCFILTGKSTFLKRNFVLKRTPFLFLTIFQLLENMKQ